MSSSTATIPPQHRQLVRRAWAVLTVAFVLFCILAFMLVTLSYNAYISAMEPRTATLIVRGAPDLIFWQREGRAAFEQARDNQRLEPGGQVKVGSAAGYGQAATIRLADNSTLDLWSGTTVRLDAMEVSQWTDSQQTMRFEQYDGYVRYDLRDDQPYERVTFEVQSGTASIRLDSGGSYSIERLPPRRTNRFVRTAFSPNITGTDIGVRAGRATVTTGGETRVLQAGERLLIDPAGKPGQVMTAEWELIRDGGFSQHTIEEYNNTTRSMLSQPSVQRSTTWQVFSGSGPVNATPNGFFSVDSICPPPNLTGDDCGDTNRTTAAVVLRTGGQTTSFITGVRQQLGPRDNGVDISEYRALHFSMWVQVLNQSIPLAGEAGTECPVMVRFNTKLYNPTDPEQERVICFFASDAPTSEPMQTPNVSYYRVPPGEWYPFSINLRTPEWLPETRFMQNIEVYANGHDYHARFTDVSLRGFQEDVPPAYVSQPAVPIIPQ